jgi:hypothetical protein
MLNLRHTKVTDVGVKRLKQALPKCKIRRDSIVPPGRRAKTGGLKPQR